MVNRLLEIIIKYFSLFACLSMSCGEALKMFVANLLIGVAKRLKMKGDKIQIKKKYFR